MRKPFEAKIMHMHETADDIRAGVRKVSDAAQSQATLNIALTAVCCLALIVAVITVTSSRPAVPHGR